ncbi:uncharacterized protein BDZ99DRAFT_421148 [Mytilinidion resinicola]|uniref:Uncharacterized protein n=1 Tax=Mytilinidion resinicola TaxID=574789 RepID=A0A6A6YGN9_9PEZI|nr:uncharacterized protein BDZ99DRAFT_421148 [Mytilinidion resinicola]KAF2807195.1 hypothetical protein BDZ99DRAFT_421148 [Mytilinidion resinicola]
MSIPLLFTIDGASRHEVVLLPRSADIKYLNGLVINTAATSPNCTEWGSKFKKQDADGPKEHITEFKIQWATEGRDMKFWPASTVITGENIEAVLAMVEKGAGRDVLVVSMGKAEK